MARARESRRGNSRRSSVVLASRKVATGGSAQPGRRTRRERSPRRMDPLARRGKMGVGRGRTTHRHGVGLPHLRSRTSLWTSSARPSSPSHARRSKRRQPDAISSALASADANPRTSTIRCHGRRGLTTRLRASSSYVVVDGLTCMRLLGYRRPTCVWIDSVIDKVNSQNMVVLARERGNTAA